MMFRDNSRRMNADTKADVARLRLNAICPYFTMFPLEMPVRHLQGLPPGSWALDPFCGRGTTNFAARLLGLRSVGVDSSPVAAAIAEAKTLTVDPERVVLLTQRLLSALSEERPPEGEFWDLAYERRTLQGLLQLRRSLLNDCGSAERKALRAIVLGSLHGPRNKGMPGYFSNQMPRTFAPKPRYAISYWRRHELTPPIVNIEDLVRRKAKYYFQTVPTFQDSVILCSDSRTVDLAGLRVRCDRVVTSPPYYGMRTYVPDQWLRYWFVGGPANVEYSREDQLAHGSPETFAAQLSDVWQKAAAVASSGAKFVVRFGGIKDRAVDPRGLLEESFRKCGSMFRLQAVKSAGSSVSGKRQADQFKRSLTNPIEEFDFHYKVLN